MNNHPVVAHRVLVKFLTTATASDRAAVELAVGGADLVPVGSHGWYRLDAPGKTKAELLTEVPDIDTVAQVVPDNIVQLAGRSAPLRPRPQGLPNVPNDPDFPLQWALNNTGQEVGGIYGTAGADVNAEEAWSYTHGSTEAREVILDSGIDYTHPDLAANVWSAPGAYTINDAGTIYNCPQGSHGFSAVAGSIGCDGQEFDDGADGGHGTMVAGIIGAVTNNGLTVAGENWTASMISVRVDDASGHSDDSTITAGIYAAEQIAATFPVAGVTVVNMSFGSTVGLPAMEAEMEGSGFLFVAATMNACQPSAEYPAAYYLANEIAASASDQNDDVAYWPDEGCSNGGGDIAAPGKNVETTDMDGEDAYFDGTSAATPYTAGGAALLWSACPLMVSGLKATLEDTADQKTALDSIATDGRRLDLGAAITSCVTGNPGTDTANVSIPAHRLDEYDYGMITITVAGQPASYYNYNTEYSTAASIAQGLVANFNSVYATASYSSGPAFSMQTVAKGPQTGLTASVQVQNECGQNCAPPPSVSIGATFTPHD